MRIGVIGVGFGAQVHIPAFQTLWGFSLASDSPFPKLDLAGIDALVAQRLTKALRYYDGESHRGMFALPRFLREGLNSEMRVNRDDDPVFML